jgi:hypothetical protein
MEAAMFDRKDLEPQYQDTKSLHELIETSRNAGTSERDKAVREAIIAAIAKAKEFGKKWLSLQGAAVRH